METPYLIHIENASSEHLENGESIQVLLAEHSDNDCKESPDPTRLIGAQGAQNAYHLLGVVWEEGVDGREITMKGRFGFGKANQGIS